MQNIDFSFSVKIIVANKVQWLLREMHRITSFSIYLFLALEYLKIYLSFVTSLLLYLHCYAVRIFILESLPPLFFHCSFFLLREQRRVRNANGRTATLWVIVLFKGKVTIVNGVIGTERHTLQKWWKNKKLARWHDRASANELWYSSLPITPVSTNGFNRLIWSLMFNQFSVWLDQKVSTDGQLSNFCSTEVTADVRNGNKM